MAHVNITCTTIIKTFLVILLVFADWNNRILVPLQFPADDLKKQREPLLKVVKLVSETVSMVLLVMFYSYFLKCEDSTEKTVNIYFLFASYLFACGVWNILMIKIMSGVSGCKLATRLFTGNIFDLPNLQNYATKFKQKQNTRTKKRGDEMSNSDNEEQLREKIKQSFWEKKIENSKKNILRTFVQVIGNHILWLNFFACILLLNAIHNFYNYTAILNKISGPYQKLFDFSPIIIPPFIIPLVMLLCFVFLFNLHPESFILNICFGMIVVVFFVCFYLFFSMTNLIYVMLFQQIIIGFIIAFITDNSIPIKE